MSLYDTDEGREEAYKEWLSETIPEEEWKLIRETVQRGQLTGNEKFQREISQQLGKRMEARGQGRPW